MTTPRDPQGPFGPYGPYQPPQGPYPGRPSGDGLFRPDLEAWDPAYPHPAPFETYGYPYGPPPQQPMPPMPLQQPPRKKRRGTIGIVAAVLAAALIASVAFVVGRTQANDSTSANGSLTNPGNSQQLPTVPNNGNSGNGNGGGNTNPFPGTNGGNQSPSTSSSGTATKTQQKGVVDINTVEKYNYAAAAGTGIVLTSDGEILTNNHVINGATSIKVTVASTGKTYVAKVVGTAPSKDIALLKLDGASGLETANLGDSESVSVGDKVTGVGNAGGVGGAPSAAKGKVTALNRTITASDGAGSSSETLHDVIVTDAPIQSGDSGGPLYNADDKVIGVDTAASTSGQSLGFAIPINNALSIVEQIRRGIETSAIHIGYPGFLGITVGQGSSSGALVQDVVRDGPADKAGISSGDVITKVGSKAITNYTQLRQAVSGYQPGSKVSITFADPGTGSSHAVSVTLIAGPAD